MTIRQIQLEKMFSVRRRLVGIIERSCPARRPYFEDILGQWDVKIAEVL